jgi:hypothetical protein
MTSKNRLIAGNFLSTGVPESVSGSAGQSGGEGAADTAGSIFDKIVREHSHTLDSDYTLDSARNGLIAGPIFIDSGVTITINDSATLVIA